MGIKLYREPQLSRPDLLACWPGIGNIGIIAVDILRSELRAEEFGEIEPWDFFYPRKVTIKTGILQDLEFPRSKFYFRKLDGRDILFFVGEEQPAGGGRLYAEGRKAYDMAGMVLDVAEKFGCRRVYTSGAAVSPTHHEVKPRVWTVANREDVAREIGTYENTVPMGEMVGADQGSITGLNGLLLGLAKKRGFEGVCLMGEIPDYLSGAMFPYPKASKSVLEVLTKLLGAQVDYVPIDAMVGQVDNLVKSIYEKFPDEIREKIDQRKSVVQKKPEAITEEDEKWIKEHVDELFKKGGGPRDRPS